MRDRWQDLRARLDARGFKPRKSLGQNFLIDPALAAAIAGEVDYSDDPLIVEVGSGPGALTRELVQKGAVLAFEIDERLASFLREESASFAVSRSFDLVEADVLEHGALSPPFVDALARGMTKHAAWVCVSNLPYSSAGPFVAAMLQADIPPRAAVVLTQWEFGERLAAKPGSATYGSLSVQAQLSYVSRLVRRVPPEVFRQRPRVASSLVVLELRDGFARRPAEWRRRFGRFVQGLFGARRKVLRQGLRILGHEEAEGVFAAAGLDADLLRRRPEELEPATFEAIFDAVEASPRSP
ncbi:MAG TPA: 16S rRNA (adenine(1518)-N(6)/adenine(1519)-N(6))-dimethyltransferase RsmA [Planctomycetota bacterium]|nr:16S rRNA (adenine(1518)-N(6)/adenine(1519)-N(6))-dimethyltransferase RsmA [Planctomycetota bacterium]